MSWSRSVLLKAFHGFDRIAAKLPSAGPFHPVKGNFSAHRLLQEGRLEGEVLREQQAPGPCPPGSMTARSGLGQHDHQPWPVFWTRTNNARIVGALRQWRDPAGRVCSEGSYHLLERRRLGEDRLLAPWFPGKETNLRGAWTSLASNWGDGRNYFHWITDNLTRLLVRERLPETTRVLIPQTRHGYVRESLEMLGVLDVCEMRDDPCLQPERYYFCSPLAMTGVWNPLGWDWLRERFLPHFRTAGSGRPVFLTRRAGTRVPATLARIESIFSDAGFDVVDCGKLAFREQIAMASGAPALAGIHGAAMTNILWCRPGTPVLEIFQPEYLNACYEQIAFQGQLDYAVSVLEGESPLREIEDWLARCQPQRVID